MAKENNFQEVDQLIHDSFLHSSASRENFFAVIRIYVLFVLLLIGCTTVPSVPTATPLIVTPSHSSASLTTPTIIQPSRTWWQPPANVTWQIQFTGEEIDTSINADVYELDLFDTSADLVAQLRAQGKHVVCYMSAGSWEDWRPDAAAFPPQVLGADYEGWPGERWLDISNLAALAPIMEARLDLCAAKGFEGVDPDNLDGFSNATGFDLHDQDAIDYAKWLADQAHLRGLGIALKNAPELVVDLEPHFDWAVVESCFVYEWCELMLPFSDRGKAVFAVEYVEEGMTIDYFCATASDLSFSAILKNRTLDAWVQFCP